jgi:hypothetical protein
LCDIKSRIENEKIGCEFVQIYLLRVGYADGEIEEICGTTMTAKTLQSQKNKLNEIIFDADLDYLRRDDFSEIRDSPYKDLKIRILLKAKLLDKDADHIS